MSIDEERKYLQAMKHRYRETDREGRKALLDEMEKITGRTDQHPDNGSEFIRRRYDMAQTPFDHLAISVELRDQLSRQRDQTNPRQLWEEIYALIDRIFQ